MAGTRDYTNTNAKTNAIPNESFSDLDISFVAHPISGDVAIKKDSDAIRRSVRNIVLTNHYERPFRPSFGANLRRLLFEGIGIGMTKKAAKEIAKALTILEPRISNVQFDITNRDNEMNITIYYVIVNTQQQQNLEFTVSRVR
jgi:phage baseplate assembly protein W|tara:strand:- start:44 stop:472 length:429 start_codon:yes stop_codon:yes gene_type:complete